MLKTGTRIHERAIKELRKKTTIDGLPYFLIILLTMHKNIKIPILEQNPIIIAYITLRLSNNQNVIVFERALKPIMYIPVETVT